MYCRCSSGLKRNGMAADIYETYVVLKNSLALMMAIEDSTKEEEISLQLTDNDEPVFD